MSFVNTQYLPHIIVVGIFLIIAFTYLNHKYFKWVKTYWFFERSFSSKLSNFLYGVSLILFLMSLLDLRGPEQKIKSDMPDQKTIIILDSSSSMLAEDVRPSRFGKAIQIARHFVKNSPGHQISIVLFSDTQKRLIPFTDDVDLLDSRLTALEKTNAISGGSNISQAVAESIQYFDTDGDKATASGNILVFTDAEESEGAFDLEVGNNINLAVVGVGTSKGGNIPLRWEDGSFKGYKNYKGEPVVTKLDEEYIKSIGKNVKNYKYWIANSYSLPTDEIKSFFRSTYNKSQGKGDVRVRPVFSHLILIPAILAYCLSVLIGRLATFKIIASIFVIVFSVALPVKTYAGDEEEKPKQIPPAIKKDLEKIKKGNADRKEILKVAEKFLKSDDEKRASEIYQEYANRNDEEEIRFNYATALLKEQKIEQALPLVLKILNESKNENVKNKMRNNLLLALEHQKNQDKKENKEEKKEENKEEKKDEDKKNKENKDGKENQKDQKKGKDQKEGKSGEPKRDPKDEKEKSENKDKKKEGENQDPKDLDKPEEKDSPKTLEEKEKMIEQKRKMVKTPAMIKQIMSDDRELQKKMMDTSTRERGEQKPKRDW